VPFIGGSITHHIGDASAHYGGGQVPNIRGSSAHHRGAWCPLEGYLCSDAGGVLVLSDPPGGKAISAGDRAANKVGRCRLTQVQNHIESADGFSA
jgi:hypothetical protein